MSRALLQDAEGVQNFTEGMQSPAEGVQSPAEGMLQQFLAMGLQFLEAAVEVWPGDSVLAQWKAVAEAARASGEESMRALALAAHAEFHATFQDSYERLKKKDETLILQGSIPVLERLGLAAKWRAADAATRASVWEYAQQLAQFSSMYVLYSKCPGGLMGKVTSMASSLVSKLEAGEMDLASINPMQLSQQMLAGMDPSDLEAFGRELSSGGDIMGMMSMVQGMVGNMGAESGMPDLSAMLGGGGGGAGAMPGLAAMLGGGQGLGALLGGGGGNGNIHKRLH